MNPRRRELNHRPQTRGPGKPFRKQTERTQRTERAARKSAIRYEKSLSDFGRKGIFPNTCIPPVFRIFAPQRPQPHIRCRIDTEPLGTAIPYTIKSCKPDYIFRYTNGSPAIPFRHARPLAAEKTSGRSARRRRRADISLLKTVSPLS